MIDADLEYAKGLGASEEVLEWCRTVLPAQMRKTDRDISIEAREHIIDYLISPDAPTRLRKMSYAQAQTAAKKWSDANQKRGRDLIETDEDTELLLALDDGARIIKLLTKKSYEREGFLMRHCLGGYAPDSTTIYSLRDKNNDPHVTFEMTKDGDKIQQIKGKGNGLIHPKYIDFVITFLKKIGLEIRVSEMQNLGYYHVNAGACAVFDKFIDSAGNGPVYSHIGGENYIFERRS